MGRLSFEFYRVHPAIYSLSLSGQHLHSLPIYYCPYYSRTLGLGFTLIPHVEDNHIALNTRISEVMVSFQLALILYVKTFQQPEFQSFWLSVGLLQTLALTTDYDNPNANMSS